ncbi:nuclear transport factor 2 family protein [Streptomyces nigra]|uniref:nuclear transport factor 2 family protein n=1 Tax=Streptomyces nigra TaxID=1827580 RepID=UPI00341510CC
MHAFRAAVEAGDTDAIEALLAEDVVFTSPAVFKPYTGKAITAAILRGVVRVFEDFKYVREINDAGGHDHALVFTARVGDKQVTGCDFLSVNEDGLIDDFIVMVRPLSGLQALAEAMGAQFDRIVADAETRSA